MKDKDQKLLWEAYISETTHSPENSCKDDEYYCSEDKVCKKKDVKEEGADRWPDGSKMDSERARHLDSLRGRDKERDLRDVWKKTQAAEQVKEIHDWDVEWNDGKWWRLDAPGGERPVTGDEHWDIMKVEDPEKYKEYHRKATQPMSDDGPDRSYQDSGDRPSFGVMG